jgi:hypothetical protein
MKRRSSARVHEVPRLILLRGVSPVQLRVGKVTVEDESTPGLEGTTNAAKKGQDVVVASAMVKRVERKEYKVERRHLVQIAKITEFQAYTSPYRFWLFEQSLLQGREHRAMEVHAGNNRTGTSHRERDTPRSTA